MTLKTTIHAAIGYVYTGPQDLGDDRSILAAADDIALKSGTGSMQADLAWKDQRTIAASGTDELDLAGSLADAFGTTLTFVKVNALLIRAASGNTNNVVLGGAASNAFQGPFSDASDKVEVQPGGALVLAAPKTGWSVAAGTGDKLLLANGGAGTSVTYDIAIIGRSA